jgi:hypothetical protein
VSPSLAHPLEAFAAGQNVAAGLVEELVQRDVWPSRTAVHLTCAVR